MGARRWVSEDLNGNELESLRDYFGDSVSSSQLRKLTTLLCPYSLGLLLSVFIFP